jgi:predicted membrane protein
MKKDYTKLFLGLIIVVIGLSLLFGQLGLDYIFGVSISFLFSILWPLIIVIVGLSIWFNSNNSFGLIVAGFGTFFLLNTIFEINVWGLFWPILLIGLGLLILFKGSVKSTADKSSEDYISVNTVFSGSEKKVVSKSFEGGNLFVLFGGSDIDLRKAKIHKDGANLEITAVFGGAKILVPDDIQVLSEGSAVFGGWENKADSSTTQNAPVLRITGAAVFGGVEIK